MSLAHGILFIFWWWVLKNAISGLNFPLKVDFSYLYPINLQSLFSYQLIIPHLKVLPHELQWIGSNKQELEWKWDIIVNICSFQDIKVWGSVPSRILLAIGIENKMCGYTQFHGDDSIPRKNLLHVTFTIPNSYGLIQIYAIWLFLCDNLNIG